MHLCCRDVHFTQLSCTLFSLLSPFFYGVYIPVDCSFLNDITSTQVKLRPTAMHLYVSLLACVLYLTTASSFDLYQNGPIHPRDISGILSGAPSACSSLGQSLKIPNVTVNFAQYVPANTNLSFHQDSSLSACKFPNTLVTVDLCRIAMYVSTSNRSGITLEAWLPTNWTGRFLSTGNGGVSGCIQYTDLAYTSGLGFATVGANNGHNGTGGEVLSVPQKYFSSEAHLTG